jgi:hypothetical protein
MRATNCLEIAKPKPVPPYLRVLEPSPPIYSTFAVALALLGILGIGFLDQPLGEPSRVDRELAGALDGQSVH